MNILAALVAATFLYTGAPVTPKAGDPYHALVNFCYSAVDGVPLPEARCEIGISYDTYTDGNECVVKEKTKLDEFIAQRQAEGVVFVKAQGVCHRASKLRQMGYDVPESTDA